MNFENTVQFVLKGAKEQNLKGLQMKNHTIVTQLLFVPGEECVNSCLIAHSILTADAPLSERIKGIFNLPNNIPQGNGQYVYLMSPGLRDSNFDTTRKVIAATLVACADDVHGFLNSLYLYSREAGSSPDFRDGCVFGLLTGLSLLRLSAKGKCDFEPGPEEITGDSAVLLCVLELAWKPHECDALPPEKVGKLTNLVTEYIANKKGEEYKSPLRMNALSNFLGQACERYKKHGHFPSQLAEAVVTDVLYKTFGVIPMTERLELVCEGIDCSV